MDMSKNRRGERLKMAEKEPKTTIEITKDNLIFVLGCGFRDQFTIEDLNKFNKIEKELLEQLKKEEKLNARE